VLSRIDLRGTPPDGLSRAGLEAVLPRASLDVEAALGAVAPICDDVRRRGGAAVRELTARFDGVDLESTRVPEGELAAALDALDPAVRAALEEAIRRCRAVHEAQRPADTVTQVVADAQAGDQAGGDVRDGGSGSDSRGGDARDGGDGLRVTERYVPVGRVGLYVPGGLVAYPSSVVMNVVPAQVAGVRSIAVATPPQRPDPSAPGPGRPGAPHPVVLAACALLGGTEVHAVGGAQAIAMFAYGTGECDPADIVTGPGNIYVAAAKRLLRGRIGTDAEAGPTEIAIIADDSADPALVAADLIAQAEHDELAACLHVTTSLALADRVDAELAARVPAARHRARVEKALAGQSAHVLVDDIPAAVAVADAWAPEHLEIQTERPEADAAKVRNAGAVFVGRYAPVSLGDYLAGSNHVLPTGGTARNTGGLSVLSFLRGIHVVECGPGALAGSLPHITALGGAEDLAAHVEAVRIRGDARHGDARHGDARHEDAR
jgi:histidinol dehydrogenase